jgi:hypothetical protein
MSIRDKFPPEDSCPCGSRRKAKSCCLLYMRKWRKRPATISPPGVVTSYSHSKCYARTTQNCNTKISREHFISDAILKRIQLNSLIKIGGLPGYGNKMQLLPRARMASRMLCQRHNSSLSILDYEGARFKHIIGYFDRGFNSTDPIEEISVFAGEDIERWLLKTVCSMLAAGKFARNGNAILHSVPDKWVKILWGLEEWPTNWGLYAPSKPIAYHSDSISIVPRSHPESGEIKVVDFEINGIPLTLVLGNPDNPEAWGVYRPRTLVFSQRGVEKYLELSWLNSVYNNYVLFDRQIPYDGSPPNWPEWAKE